MKKVLLFLSLFFVSINFVVAQAPGIKWQKCIGGSYVEDSHKLLKSKYGGYILLGNTSSNDYDVQGMHGTEAYDGWVVKTNESGQIIWQKCLGGSANDFMQSAQELENGDIIIIMTATSVDGDV